MVDFINTLLETIHKIETDVNEIVWTQAELNMKQLMLDNCSELKKIATEMKEMLKEDHKRSTKKILLDCNSIDDLMYNRGRIAQIQKMTEQQ